MTNPPSDQGIPVLTEVISPDSSEVPPSKPESNQASAPVVQQAAPLRSSGTTTAAPPRTPTLAPGQAAGVTRPPSPPSSSLSSPPPAAPMRTVSPPPAAPAMPLTAAAPKPDPSATATELRQAAPNPDTLTGTSWSDEDWTHLETELRQRITRQVLGRIDFVLDHRVRSTLSDVIDNAIDGLATEIKHSLHATLTDMVARAVAQEIARIQPPKK